MARVIMAFRQDNRKYIYLIGETVPKKFFENQKLYPDFFQNLQAFEVKASRSSWTFPKFPQFLQTVPESNSRVLIDLFTPVGGPGPLLPLGDYVPDYLSTYH